MIEIIDTDDESNNLAELRKEERRIKKEFVDFLDNNSNENEIKSIDSNDLSSSAKTLLIILLLDPEQHELKLKPSGIRSDFLCTLNSSHISIELCKADDNGAYSSPSSATKLFYVQFGDGNITEITVCHSENDTLYINIRVGRKYVKETLSPENVYKLTRQCRYSKSNPGFVHIIATAKRQKFLKNLHYYILMYKNE